MILLRRVLCAWLIADGDMHLKTWLCSRRHTRGEKVFRTVRMTPVYDALPTRVFPGLEHERMALELGGKDERLTRGDFGAVATLAGLRAADAKTAIDDLLNRLGAALDTTEVPAPLARDAAAGALVAKTLELCSSRVAAFESGDPAQAAAPSSSAMSHRP